MNTLAEFLQDSRVVLSLAGVFVLLGFLVLFRAWRTAESFPAKSGILSGIGGALVTGATLAVMSLYLQAAFAHANEESTWRANVNTSFQMAGLVVKGHDLHDPEPLNFSGKELRDADFRDAEAEGIQFRDAKLRGSDFHGANLRDASFVAADLTGTEFAGADLSGADLRVTHFIRSRISDVRSMQGARVDANTCWPIGFLTSGDFENLRQQLVPVETTDGATGKRATSLGYEEARGRPCRPFD